MELGGMCPRRVPRYLISLPVPLGHSHSKGFPMFGLGTLLLCSILFCFYIGTRAIGTTQLNCIILYIIFLQNFLMQILIFLIT